MTDTYKISVMAKEVLEKQINQSRKELPFSLKVKDIVKLTNSTKPQVYDMLDRKQIPGAKKIKGLGWRIPRDVFLSWWYGNQLIKEVKINE